MALEVGLCPAHSILYSRKPLCGCVVSFVVVRRAVQRELTNEERVHCQQRKTVGNAVFPASQIKNQTEEEGH